MDGYAGVFEYRATLDSAAGPERVMEGRVETNGRTVGSFSARPVLDS